MVHWSCAYKAVYWTRSFCLKTGSGAVLGGLLRDANQVARRVARLLERSPACDVRTQPGLEQELVRHRRRPGELPVLHQRAQVASGLGRRRGTEAAEADRANHG